MKRLIFSLLGWFIVMTTVHLGIARDDYWQQYVHYDLKVQLDPGKNALRGETIIIYQNNSPDTLDRVYLHLYPNAFKNEKSTFAREAKRRYYRGSIAPDNSGYIDILEFRISRKDSSVAPHDAPVAAYQVNDTILEALLPEPLLPGGELQLYIKFYEKIPSLIIRAGRRGNQYDFGQWYPKLVVYDQDGWHPDQYHADGEFYGEFGTFDVSITLPYNYIVCSTGVPVEGDPGWSWVQVDTGLTDEAWRERYSEQLKQIERLGEKSKERTVKFHAEQVHDFAWSACPDFVYERGDWKGIPIHVLYRSYAKPGWSKKVAQRGARVLEWLSTRFGRYPYPQLTIMHGLIGGGMEYPMLVMNSSPDEGLISHEVGHIYFYGILANNELAEAWMDEGFTSYQEFWYQQVNFGPWGYESEDIPDTNSWKFKINPTLPRKENTIQNLVDYLTSGYNEPMSQYAHKFKGGYGINAYTKGAAFFMMLHYIVGDSLWDVICHTYFDRWKFKHVNEQRFKQVVEDVTGDDFDWYFDQWMRRTVAIDYGLGRIFKSQLPNGQWQLEVEVKRNDAGMMPVEVQLITQSGKTIIDRWDGKAKQGKLKFITDDRPDRVILDPRDAILDKNRLNNGDWQFQFLPDMASSYSPRNAYLIRYAPMGWYNDVDGLWLGPRFKGSYLRKYYRSEVGITYGLKSNRTGYHFALGHPILRNSDKLQFDVTAIHREGRGMGEIALTYRTSSIRFIPPFHQLRLSFDSAQLIKDGEQYAQRKIESVGEVVRVSEWDRGRISKISLGYDLDIFQRQSVSNFKILLETARRFWGSEFHFTKLFGEWKLSLGSRSKGLRFRLVAGNFWGDKIPIQEQFFIDGGNPRERFSQFYLRSAGSMPVELRYHFPGGGNLRGYIDQPVAATRIAAANVEARTSVLDLLLNKILPPRSSLELSPFFDFARVATSQRSYRMLMDAGIGLRFGFRLLNQRRLLRLDFPVWLNEPLPGQKQMKFRWLFSFQPSI